MLNGFFNGSGPIVVNFLPLNLKFNGQCYIDNLEEIRMNIYPNERAQRKARKILHYDNFLSHLSLIVKDYIENSEFRKMPYPDYPPDFGLFSAMKENLLKLSMTLEYH